MEKYIATKPVRFDRDYEVGDEIPAIAIDPRMEKRLIEAGKIARVTAPDNGDGEPQTNLIGGSLEQSVAFLEDILGIDHGGEKPPDLETRAETCKEIIVEIRNTADRLKSQNEKHNKDRQEDYENKIPENMSEILQDTPEGAGDINNRENMQDRGLDPLVGEQTAQSDTQTAGAAANDLTCLVCGKVCGSKSALTTHMKTHETK